MIEEPNNLNKTNESNEPQEESSNKVGNFLIVNFILLILYSLFGAFFLWSPFFLIPVFTGLITGLSIFLYNKSIGQALGYAVLFLLVSAIVGFSICIGSINIH